MHARAVVNHLPAILFDQSTERTSGPKTDRPTEPSQRKRHRAVTLKMSRMRCRHARNCIEDVRGGQEDVPTI